VVGSRGSVILVFKKQRECGRITVTDKRMTRFWLTLEKSVRFVISCIERMQGGEVFVPKIPSMRIVDLAEAVAPGCDIEVIGIRPGEKLHEVLIARDESRQTLELDDMFVIQPAHPWWKQANWSKGKPLPDGYKFASDKNDHWLTIDELRRMIGEGDEQRAGH
jgi:UDP-N-acetylglucosamine 4,6-dehydratase